MNARSANALFSSDRERHLWIWTLGVVVAIFSTLSLASSLAVFVNDRGALGVVLFVFCCLLVLSAVVTQGLTSRPGRAEVLVALGVAAVYLLVFVRMAIPTERSHLVEYGVVAILVYEALTERVRRGRRVAAPALVAILITSAIGVIDEAIQFFLPSRVFDRVDILFNVLAAVMAVGTSVALARARRLGRHLRASRIPASILGLALAGCVAHASPSGAGFERQVLLLDATERQTVLAGFLLDQPVADLAVVSIDDEGIRRLRVYASTERGWVPEIDGTLRPELRFVDVAKIGGRDRLLTYEPGRLSWFDPESRTERPFLSASATFDPPRKNEVPHVDVTRDLNGDGLDDLALPGNEGFAILVQRENGSFADPVIVGRKADLAGIYGADGCRYDPWSRSRIHPIDYDQDGRSDLVYWAGDRFAVHFQEEDGAFAPRPRLFEADVPFDSDDPSFLLTGEMAGRVLHSLADLNGDGIGDLVIQSLHGGSVRELDSSFDLHLGKATRKGGTTFAPEADLTFREEGRIQLGMVPLPADPEGGIGLMFTTIDRDRLHGSLWKKLKGMMGDDVGLNLEFHRGEDGSYPGEPATTREIALDGAPSHREPGWVPLEIALRGATHETRRTDPRWPRAFNQTLLIGDVTGDGRADLLIEPEFHTLHVYPGVPGPEIFAREPESLAVSLHDGEYAWLFDLNRDGKQDLLLHETFLARTLHGGRELPEGSERQRVTVLLAN